MFMLFMMVMPFSAVYVVVNQCEFEDWKNWISPCSVGIGWWRVGVFAMWLSPGFGVCLFLIWSWNQFMVLVFKGWVVFVCGFCVFVCVCVGVVLVCWCMGGLDCVCLFCGVLGGCVGGGCILCFMCCRCWMSGRSVFVWRHLIIMCVRRFGVICMC